MPEYTQDKQDNFERALDDLLHLQDKYTSKSIDAAACRTDWDYKKRNAAETAFENARERFIANFGPTALYRAAREDSARYAQAVGKMDALAGGAK